MEGTTGSCIQVVAVNGCCYGKDSSPDKGDYYKYCGQDFWKFISGNDSLYKEIIEPLGYKAKEKNEEFKTEYNKILNLFVAEFIKDYCFSDGSIDWDKLVEYNSGRKVLK
jgi:hypothetical protein